MGELLSPPPPATPLKKIQGSAGSEGKDLGGTLDSSASSFLSTGGRVVPQETDSEVEISGQEVYCAVPWG